ncbi:hypothetical protein ES703_114396 [subsurface metagenome]
MSATAKLGAYRRFAYFHHPNLFSIFLVEKGNSTFINSLLVWNNLAYHWQILAYPFIDDMLNLIKLLLADSCQVREIKTKSIRSYQRASLLNTTAQHLTQSCLKQMCRSMIASDIKATAYINLSFNDIADRDATFDDLPQMDNCPFSQIAKRRPNGVSDINLAGIDNHLAGITHLASHLAIERCFIKDNSNLLAFTRRGYRKTGILVQYITHLGATIQFVVANKASSNLGF